MRRAIWLASYPKSGNTWFRVLITGSLAGENQSVDINELEGCGSIASSRGGFERGLLIDPTLLTHEEVECLRPRLHDELTRSQLDVDFEGEWSSETEFIKVHDAYTLTSHGEPLLAGAKGAKGAIVIVRDPRDIVASCANHMGKSLDEAIAFMNDENSEFGGKRIAQPGQLRQRLLDWSGHVRSWLEQRDIPVHLIRYEDLKANTVLVFVAAMEFAGRRISLSEAHRTVGLASFHKLRAQEAARGFREAPPMKKGSFFFRRGQSGGWRSELSVEQVLRIEAKHGAMMERLGYQLSACAQPRLSA